MENQIYLIKLDNLSSNKNIGDLFEFFHLLTTAYNDFLLNRLTIEQNYEICYIKDKLFFNNELHDFDNKKEKFRLFSKEIQDIILLKEFQAQWKPKNYNNELIIHEFPMGFKVGYGFHLSNEDETLSRFLKLHDCIVSNEVYPIEFNKQNQIILKQNSSIKVAFNFENDIFLYNETITPTYLDRMKVLSKCIIDKTFKDMQSQKLDVLHNQVDNLEFPKLKDLFLKINHIMQFNLTENEIDGFFIDNDKKADKRKRKIKHKK